MLEYGSISRFKGVFSGFYMFGVGLCCLGALLGLCGFCARVELGGLEACGVFASILSAFHLLCPCLVLLLLCLPPFMLVVILCSGCLYLFSCIVFVFSFSLSDGSRHKKKGRKGLSLASSLVLLWVVLSGCGFILLVLVRCQPVYIVIKF